jgi:hypothetical protein
MATIKRGTTASGPLKWGLPTSISLQPIAVGPKPPKPPDPPKPEPPIVLPPKPEPPKPKPPEPEPPVPSYFPTDAEFAGFYLWLNHKYHTDPKMQPRPLLAKSMDPATYPDVYVDPIGQGRWCGEFYYNCVAKGMTAAQSTAAVDKAINDIVDP